MGVAEVTPVLDESVRDLCCRPYPGHPKGCPNWGKRDTCPPAAPLLQDILTLVEPVFAVWNRFDLAAHVARMRERHPGWSDRQLYCCLCWQGTARKQLRAKIKCFLHEQNLANALDLKYHVDLLVVGCPEACGVNVTATLASIGITLEWPPRVWAYQVVLVGQPLHRVMKREAEDDE